MIKVKLLMVTGLISTLAIQGCNDSPPAVGSFVRAILSEWQGGTNTTVVVAHDATPAGSISHDGYLEDPIMTRFAKTGVYIEYPSASGSTKACSANWIGPNLLITAGHCFFDNGVSFSSAVRAYHVSYTASTLMPFGPPAPEHYGEAYCRVLVNDRISPTARSGDIALLYCEDVQVETGFGMFVPPGDLYGYVNWRTDPIPEPQVPTTGVAKVWGNPLGTRTTWDSLLSYGSDLEAFDPDLTSPVFISGGTCPSGTPPGLGCLNRWFEHQLCLNSGVSGSLSFDPADGRVIVGPHSAAPASWLGACTTFPERNTSVAASALFDTWELTSSQISVSALSTWITNPAVNATGVQSSNGVLKIQEAIEEMDGRAVRGFHWLGFENRARNRAWFTTPTGVTFYPEQTRAPVPGATEDMSEGWVEMAPGAGMAFELDLDMHSGWYPRMNALTSVGGGMITVEVKYRGASAPTIKMYEGPASVSVANGTATASPVPIFDSGDGFATFAPSSLPDTYAMRIEANAATEILSVSVRERATAFDYQSHDSRMAWVQRVPSGYAPAFVVPFGPDTFPGPHPGSPKATPDWALAVPGTSGGLGPLPQVTTQHTRNVSAICVDVLPPPSGGTLRATGLEKDTSGVVYTSHEDHVYGAGLSHWDHVCFGFGANVEFGFSATINSPGEYFLVDNIMTD